MGPRLKRWRRLTRLCCVLAATALGLAVAAELHQRSSQASFVATRSAAVAPAHQALPRTADAWSRFEHWLRANELDARRRLERQERLSAQLIWRAGLLEDLQARADQAQLTLAPAHAHWGLQTGDAARPLQPYLASLNCLLSSGWERLITCERGADFPQSWSWTVTGDEAAFARLLQQLGAAPEALQLQALRLESHADARAGTATQLPEAVRQVASPGPLLLTLTQTAGGAR